MSSEEEKQTPVMDVVHFCLYISFAIYAAWLSWNCNVGMNMLNRGFYAVMSSFFGPIYIILFYLMKAGLCKV